MNEEKNTEILEMSCFARKLHYVFNVKEKNIKNGVTPDLDKIETELAAINKFTDAYKKNDNKKYAFITLSVNYLTEDEKTKLEEDIEKSARSGT